MSRFGLVVYTVSITQYYCSITTTLSDVNLPDPFLWFV